MNINDVKGTTTLDNDVQMPYFGLGVYKARDGEEVISSVTFALENGYRLIDTASFYNNEEGVGKAIRNSGIPREQIFVTTKLWIDDQGTSATRNGFNESLKRLGLEYVDLYLIHWPVPGKYLDSWKIIQDLYKEGKCKAIGVSNCLIHHLEKIKDLGGVQPMVLQNEFHPRLIQQEVVDFCKENAIQYQAWSPLMRGNILDNTLLESLRRKYNKSTAQIVLRWNLQKGVATIPKSVHQDRILENSQIFDFELSENDMLQIDGLNNENRTGAHPDNFMEHFKR